MHNRIVSLLLSQSALRERRNYAASQEFLPGMFVLSCTYMKRSGLQHEPCFLQLLFRLLALVLSFESHLPVYQE